MDASVKQSAQNPTQHDDLKQYAEANEITITGQNFEGLSPIVEFKNDQIPACLVPVLLAKGYTEPQPIQSVAWSLIMAGKNVVGNAVTGAGKTLAFIVPLLVHVSRQEVLQVDDGPIALILVPTRELAEQIVEVATPLCEAMTYKIIKIIGGESKEEQSKAVSQGAHIYVCTPGRILDLLDQCITTMYRVSMLVLDEADKMMDMGFEKQVRAIVQKSRDCKQTAMFSATWPKSISQLASDIFRNSKPNNNDNNNDKNDDNDNNDENITDGDKKTDLTNGDNFVRIVVGSQNTYDGYALNTSIKQTIIVCSEVRKDRELLSWLVDILNRPMHKTIIFCRTKGRVNGITTLIHDRFSTTKPLALHGGKNQSARDATIRDFKNIPNSVLVATDVASRGIDVGDVHCILNVDYPAFSEVYIHRIGRTGRVQGYANGEAITFFTPQTDRKHAPELVRILRSTNSRVPIELAKLAEIAEREQTHSGRPHAQQSHIDNVDSGLAETRTAQANDRDKLIVESRKSPSPNGNDCLAFARKAAICRASTLAGEASTTDFKFGVGRGHQVNDAAKRPSSSSLPFDHSQLDAGSYNRSLPYHIISRRVLSSTNRGGDYDRSPDDNDKRRHSQYGGSRYAVDDEHHRHSHEADNHERREVDVRYSIDDVSHQYGSDFAGRPIENEYYDSQELHMSSMQGPPERVENVFQGNIERLENQPHSSAFNIRGDTLIMIREIREYNHGPTALYSETKRTNIPWHKSHMDHGGSGYHQHRCRWENCPY